MKWYHRVTLGFMIMCFASTIVNILVAPTALDMTLLYWLSGVALMIAFMVMPDNSK